MFLTGYGAPVAIVGDSSCFCLQCAGDRYGHDQITSFVQHDAVSSLSGRDGELLSVAREGMHDLFLYGVTCEVCGTPLCAYIRFCQRDSEHAGCQCRMDYWGCVEEEDVDNA